MFFRQMDDKVYFQNHFPQRIAGKIDTTGSTARVRELIQKHLQDAPMQFLRPILAHQNDGSHRKKHVFFLRKMLGI